VKAPTELPLWVFEIEEISNGAYQATGHDTAGRSVSVQGSEPDALLEQCKQAAIELVRKQQNK